MQNFISPTNFSVASVHVAGQRLFFYSGRKVQRHTKLIGQWLKNQLSQALVKTLGALCLALSLSHCAVTPTTVTQGPLTAKATSVNNAHKTDGSIYAASHYRPLFEDRRPRMVGDIITINIIESTNVSKDGNSSASKQGAVDASIASFRGRGIPSASLSANSELGYSDDAKAASSNRFNGFITTTVIDVLPNGNLVVSGEKQIALDKGTEFVRFSGVVNPDTVALGNTVPSSRVADARIEYRTNSKLDTAQVVSILSRFFLSFIPL